MAATATGASGSMENTPSTGTMRATVCSRFGPPERLTVEEIDRPVVDADRVLLRVRAASVNPADYHNMKGGLVLMLMTRSRRPDPSVLGCDVAGVVEEVGEEVPGLRPGDEVFGTCGGSFAEYALGGKNLVVKPANLSFEQAAAIPIAGITALQAVRDKGQLQPGQTVLINGAAGGVGTFAVQIAKALGGHVTGVCSTRNVELVRSLGADRVVDYTRQDFARSGQRHDLVVDVVGNRSLADLRRALTPAGTLVLTGGAHHHGHGTSKVRPLLLLGRGLLLSRFVEHKIVPSLTHINPADLLTLKELAESGKITPVIDRAYPLGEVPEAMRYLGEGHARGKVLITV